MAESLDGNRLVFDLTFAGSFRTNSLYSPETTDYFYIALSVSQASE